MKTYFFRIITYAFAAVMLTLITSCAKDEVDLTGTISGFVSDYTNANSPIAGASLTLSGKGITKTTGTDGRFEFTDLEPGTYTISVKANNYQPTTKQVTVYAGQKANCDIQLQQEKIVVDISPVNLAFGKDVDQLSFSISNKSSRDLAYSIVSYLDYVEVSPMIGTVKANSIQAIAVKIKSRSTITNDINGQIIINIGNDSYNVNLSISGTASTATTGIIAGSVTDYSNTTAISGATVTLTSTGQTKTTGTDGLYEFSDLAPGKHTISVSANGYETVSKDVTVEAGKTTNCDFKLQKSSANVDVSPLNLSYASDVEELSFTIKNNSSNALSYTVSNVPDFAQISSSNGMVAAKGSQAIKVNILNRKTITSKRNGQLTVNVGDNSYIITLSVDPYQEEAVSVDISPSQLSFGNTDEILTFKMVSKNSRPLDYSINSDLSILSVSPDKGTIKEKGTVTVSVSVQDRKKIDVDRHGNLTIRIEGNSFVIPVTVTKYVTNISVSPEDLSFDSDTDNLNFVISNGESAAVDYTISNNREDILTVSPASGSINGNSQININVKVKDRKSITSDQHAQLAVSAGGKTFYVYATVSEFKVKANVSPQSLSFDKDTERLEFTITNNNNVAWDYSVSSDLNILSLTPFNGTISAKGSATVAVSVNNRSSVTEDKTGSLTLYCNGKNFGQINVKVAKYENGGSQPSGIIVVTGGLMAYYTFDNETVDDNRGNYHGFNNGASFITDNPSGTGKALFIKNKQYVNIASAPFNGKQNYSVNLWIKDWGTGPILSSQGNSRLYGPTLYMTETGKLLYYATDSWNSDCRTTFSADLSSYQSGQWIMLTVVTTNEKTSSLYINGRKAASATVTSNYNSGAVSMSIGGSTYYTSSPVSSNWADPMKVDNIRLYSVALSDEDIEEIYKNKQ